jgi:pimeloyl-ACP methyl ester carboxylesterase
VNKLQFKTRQVTAEDGTQLATYAYGTGDTPAIIANGLGGTLIAWTPLLEALSKTYRFISWDYRGLYDSERPRDTSAFSVNDHVSDMQVVLNAYGVETAVGFGWSMGVQVSIQAAADLKRLTSLVLLNGTFGRIFDTAFHPLSRPALPLLNRLAIKAAPWLPSVVSAVTRQSWFIDALDSAQLVDSSVDRQIFESVAKEFSRLDFDAYHRIMGALAEHDGTGALARLDIPILFLTGSRDLVTPPTVAEIVQGLAPQTVVHEIEGATHYALLEYPKNVLDQIHQFIAALDSPINSK